MHFGIIWYPDGYQNFIIFKIFREGLGVNRLHHPYLLHLNPRHWEAGLGMPFLPYLDINNMKGTIPTNSQGVTQQKKKLVGWISRWVSLVVIPIELHGYNWQDGYQDGYHRLWYHGTSLDPWLVLTPKVIPT
jgi:hypothetical protein